MTTQETRIARHKTAIRRYDLSLPVKCLLRDGLLGASVSMFDYGCGHGENIDRLRIDGFTCEGWDPVFRPDSPRVTSDIVNLGYVVNVVEDPVERSETLRCAWALAEQLLVVSARIKMPGRGKTHVEFGDGVVTRLGTFQKYYTQSELQEYLQSELGNDALPAALGVFYVFKDELLQQQYLANRYRRRAAAPRKRVSETRFEESREILEPLIASMSELGRLPEVDELDNYATIVEKFGSIKRASGLIKRVTSSDEWETIREERTQDLLVYLALARFRRRPPLGKLPVRLRRDIRAFFGSYKQACAEADKLLFQAGNAEAIDEECKQSEIGKLLPTALYVHREVVERLSPLLRIYEGCARAYVGEIEDSTIVKLHRFSGKVSYLSYPDFESDPHPALVRSVKVFLRTLDLDCYDYSESDNPPILHRKETFLSADHPLRDKFSRLTRIGEMHGLLDDTSKIGTRKGWEARLAEAGLRLRGHRIVKSV